MALIKTRARGLKLDDTFAFTGTVSGAGGITEYDLWWLTANVTGDVNPITSNLSRCGAAGFEKIGTGMTESSGVFTFPSTGKYEVKFNIVQYPSTGNTRFTQHSIQLTTNNSSYSNVSQITVNLSDESGGIDGQMGVCHALVDITDVSTHKVRFTIISNDNSSGVHGSNGSYNYTYMTFIKLGDT